MPPPSPPENDDKPGHVPPSFEEAARTARQSTLRDAFAYLRETRKLWLSPVLVILLILGLVLALSGTVLSPLIYTLF
ncbi:DUF5989 family protein [Polyangium mundeleinium]|uniref:DUF5989 family protein n=1 Tax=Polyangium mundeleinium TaxID=2995306 RepID=A0ABT5EQ11_9BACT|nr:DUF5989 family protein [Polyangium mundeleinium]MDC0743925.1 DUF5989 family protein [Polyangium mundeleinium]